MTEQQPTPQQPAPHHPADRQPPVGEPLPQDAPARGTRWTKRKTVAAGLVAAGIVAAGGAAVYAAGGSTSAAEGGPGGGMRGMGGPGGGGSALVNALHGEFTVSDGSGGYSTAIMQTGEVTAITDTSLTAKSEDGYTKVYTIDSETVFGSGSASDIENGDTVTVVATPDGSNATADSVSERGQGAGGGGAPGQDGQQGVPPRRDGDATESRPTG